MVSFFKRLWGGRGPVQYFADGVLDPPQCCFPGNGELAIKVGAGRQSGGSVKLFFTDRAQLPASPPLQ